MIADPTFVRLLVASEPLPVVFAVSRVPHRSRYACAGCGGDYRTHARCADCGMLACVVSSAGRCRECYEAAKARWAATRRAGPSGSPRLVGVAAPAAN